MDIREWIFVLGVIVVVIGALVWAAKWRRQRFDDIRPGDYSDEGEAFPTSELPSGGARTVGYRDPTDIERMNDEIRARAEASKPRLSSFRPEPVEQTSLLLDDEPEDMGDDFDEDQEADVPLLLDPSDQHNRENALNTDTTTKNETEQGVAQKIEQESEIQGSFKDEQKEPPVVLPEENQAEVRELESLANELREDEPELALHVEKEDKPDRLKAEKVKQPAPSKASGSANQTDKSSKSDRQDKPIDPSEIIIINLMTKPETPFEGELLYKVVSELGLRHGDMKIFHYCGRHGDAEPQFRMANLVKPGYFDLDDIASTRTHALCFFFELMPDQDNMKIYETMLSVINKIRDDMGGELHDENRSVFTIQTSEHCRNRIRDFQRKHLLKR